MPLYNVPTTSYEAFKNATLGNFYDISGVYGAQCVDLAKLLWYNIGYPSPYFRLGSLGYAYEGWTVLASRIWNAGDKFALVYNLEDVKQGDMVILGPSTGLGEAGHNGFADSDYKGGSSMVLLGQNQVNPNPVTGHATTLTPINVSTFLGAFRYKTWDSDVPPSGGGYPVTRTRGDFPWFIYARRRRGET